MSIHSASTSAATSVNAATSSYHYSRLGALLYHHRQSALVSLKRIWSHPLAGMLTLAVIGVALALPALLTVLLHNADTVSKHWSGSSQMTVYLSKNSNAERANQIIKLLNERHHISKTRYISPAEGLATFERNTGIHNILGQLHSNPLPGVIEVLPNTANNTPQALQTLMQEIQQFPGVESVKLDLTWVARLHSIISFAKRLIYALAVLLGLAVLLVIGNTIRLATQNRREEIKITKLIGATNSFIRRPFLYTGFFYGLFGAILSWIVVATVIAWLGVPITSLAMSYHSPFQLQGLTAMGVSELLFIGAALGFVGAWIAVNLQIKQIEFC